MERMICPITIPTNVFLLASSLNSVISYNFKNISSIFIFFLSLISFYYLFSLSFGSEYTINAQNQNQNQTIMGSSLTDQHLRVELVARDFDFPTSIEFLGKDDFLLLEKNTGDIYRIHNGNVTGPLIHIHVSQKDERGLLGITILENDNLKKDKTFVFLYYTLCTKDHSKYNSPCGNYVYRYRFETENNTLTEPKLILSLPAGFDPLTGNLWDTENGPQFGDEINLVKPGFNSGWEKVQGIWKLNQTREKDGILNESSKEVELVNFNGKGKYSKPEFVWDKTVAPTALIFLDSEKLGKKYKNDIFVGSAKNGRIFDFNLKENRKSLSLSGNLADLVLN